MLSLSTAAVTVLGLCLGGAAADGSVVGSAQPGTMAGTFTVPFSEFESTTASGCSTSFAGCTGEFLTKEHEVAGIVTVIDDCTFRIQGWQFDGLGPAVEWWGSKQGADVTDFMYPTNAIKIGELGAPGAYQQGSDHGGDSDVVVRLGKDDAGAQIEFSDDLNHISVWCEDVQIDFGNAALACGDAATPAASTEPSGALPKQSAVGGVVALAAVVAPLGLALL